MPPIQIIDNFLEPTLINSIKRHIKINSDKYKWSTNLFWEGHVRHTSTQVSAKSLVEDINISQQLKATCDPHVKKYTDLQFDPYYFAWHKLSYIPFHKDQHAVVAFTIYLNENWSEDYGGFYLYKNKEDNYKVIFPQFNRCIIQKDVVHGTSLTTMHAPYRETLQIWYVKNATN